MKKLVFCLSLCGFILAGCSRNEPAVEPDGDRQVVIFFKESKSASSLKSAGTEEEDALEKVILYGIDGLGVIIFTDTIDHPSPAGDEVTMSRMVETLYAIANPSNDLETVLESVELSDNVSDLTTLVNDFSDAPESPFLMGGKGAVPPSGFSVTVNLVRAVAKIEIIALNEFEITTVTVLNTSTKGYVFEQSTFSLPSSLDRDDYAPVPPTSATMDTTILYVAESPKENPVEFEVTGVFTGVGDLYGKTATFSIILQQDGVDIDIVRNTRYRVRITPITEWKYDIEFFIVPWNEVEADIVEIPDEDFI